MKFLYLLPVLTVLLSAGGCVSSPDAASTDPTAEQCDSLPVFSGHIYLPATIGRDSVRGEFVFDTGASGLCLDSLFFALHFPDMKTAQGRISGIGNASTPVHLILDPLDFTIPSGAYKSPATVVLPLKQIVGRRADGIVGLDFFIGRYVEIDYLHGRFGVTDRPDTAGFRRLPLLYRNGRLFVRMKVTLGQTDIEGLFLLDTGSGGKVDISSAAIRKSELEKFPGEKARYRNRFGGAGGESRYLASIAREIRIDTFCLKDVRITYSLDKAGALASQDYLGLVGSGFLERFDLVVDLKGMNLFLRPNALYGKPFENKQHGILYANRTDIGQGFIINGMREGGAGEKSGLKEGDILTAIGGKAVKSMSERQVDALLRDTSKATLRLTVLRATDTLSLSFIPQLSL